MISAKSGSFLTVMLIKWFHGGMRMKRNFTQLIAAFLMGVVMPALAMQLGQAVVSAGPQQATQNQTAPPGTTADQQIQQASTVIPVLLGNNTLRMMELDEYLLGVVLAEMPVDFEAEALKAQAIAARTCALQCTREATKHPGGAVCADPKCCQAYIDPAQYLRDGGFREKVDKVQRAILDTAGQILTYQGELIQATYFSCSGGRTEDAVAVWGADVPYLKSVESPGEEHADIYANTVQFSSNEFAALLGRNLRGNCADWLGAVTYTRGGGVATMVIAGKTYTGTELREKLDLYSTAFSMVAEGNTISVTTSGKGHRVGMSQYGADAMAKKGCTHEEILAHYYPGTRIDKVDALR